MITVEVGKLERGGRTTTVLTMEDDCDSLFIEIDYDIDDLTEDKVMTVLSVLENESIFAMVNDDGNSALIKILGTSYSCWFQNDTLMFERLKGQL